MAALATMPRSHERPLSSSPGSNPSKPLSNPCKTKWQQKWIALDVVAPPLQTLANEAEDFCARWYANDAVRSLMVIVGAYGSGKTHTARSIFRFCSCAAMNALESGKWGSHKLPNSIFISWPEAASAFAEKQFGVMEDALEHDLVILDDIGAENDPWKVSADRLCQILSRREKKFTVVTTNVPAANWIERFDGRINDRLMRNSTVIDISGVPSYAMR